MDNPALIYSEWYVLVGGKQNLEGLPEDEVRRELREILGSRN